MKCTDFENRLNALLDDRLSPENDAALVAHAENCLDCREILAAQESLFRGMAQLKRRSVVVVGTSELGTRVLSELNAPAATITLPPPVRKPFRWLTILASAAAVLLAVGVGMWIVSQRGRQASVAQPGQNEKDRHPGFAIIKPGGSGSRTPKNAPAPQPESVHPESIAVAPPPKVEPMRVPAPIPPQPFGPQPDIDGAMASIASHWPVSAQWPQVETIDVEQYAPGIRPIRESFEVAIDALLKTIPQGKKESRPGTPGNEPGPPQAQYGEALDLA